MNDENKGSGRTTRMLQHALTIMRGGKQAIVFAVDVNHAKHLVAYAEELLKLQGAKADLEAYEFPIKVMSFSSVLNGNRMNLRGRWLHYDYRTNSMPWAHSQAEYLIDHAALEHHLRFVTGYLSAMESIKEPSQWLIDTARVLAELGRRVYLLTDDEMARCAARAELVGYNVGIESLESLSNFDPVTISMRDVHPNCQLLADPAMIRRMFAGALNEMKRWDQ